MPSHHTGEIILKFKSLFYLCYILYFILPRPRLLPLPLLEGFYYLLKHEVARDLMDDTISLSLFSIWAMLAVNRTNRTENKWCLTLTFEHRSGRFSLLLIYSNYLRFTSDNLPSKLNSSMHTSEL